jgi:hypothetical protein
MAHPAAVTWIGHCGKVFSQVSKLIRWYPRVIGGVWGTGQLIQRGGDGG